MTKKKSSLKNRRAAFNLAFLIIWISTFIAGIMIFGWSRWYPVVWRSSMFMNAPMLINLVSISLITCIVVPLHKYIRAYLFDFCFAFSLLLVFSQAGLIANGMLDKSTVQSWDATVVDKTTIIGYRGAVSYYALVRDWASEEKTVRLEVTEAHYKTIQRGDTIQVKTKRGFFGYEWVVNKRQIMFGTP